MPRQLPLTAEDLETLKREKQGGYRDFAANVAYVQGKNPDIMNQRGRKDPDNRIPIPLAKIAVEDVAGYAGRAGDIRLSWDNLQTEENEGEEADRDEYIEIRRKVADHNDSDLITSQVYEEALTQGVAYEMHWISDELELDYGLMTPEYAMVPGDELTLIFEDSLKPDLLAFVRYWKRGKDEIADAYYPLYWERWIKPQNHVVYALEEAPETEETEEGETQKVRDTRFRTYPYKRPPLAIYPINRKEVPLFESEKLLIDALDKLLSSSVNEVDRFNALIALFPGTVDKKFRDKLIELKVIDELGEYEHWPEYLEKSLEKISDFYNQLADRIERLFHKSVKVPDMTDENFAGNQSGVAIAYKLIGLEFKASQIETYFNTGLQMRNELVNDVLSDSLATVPYDVDDYRMVIDAKRNIPIDEASKVTVAMQLLGIVSRETVLRFLPQSIVEDVERELARLDAEPSMTLGDMDNDEPDSVDE